MAFHDFLSSNRPPKGLVDWMKARLGVEPFDENDPGLWFAVAVSAAMMSWLKRDDGVGWIFSVNGIRRVTHGPWDVFSIVNNERRRTTSIAPDRVFAWDRARPVFRDGPLPGAADVIRSVLKRWDVPIPAQAIQGIPVDEGMQQSDFQAKVALLASMLAGGWFNTPDGHLWAFEQYPIIEAVVNAQDRVYSEGMEPIVGSRVVQHTRKRATASCCECGTEQPCVKEEIQGDLCRHCLGYLETYNSSAHDTCRQCDITDCPHWAEFSGLNDSNPNQAWLLSVQ